MPDNGMPRDVAIVPDLSVVLITPDSFETIRRTVTCVVRRAFGVASSLSSWRPRASRSG